MRYPEEWPTYSMDVQLAMTRQLQMEYFGGDPADLPVEERNDFVRNMILALIVEATEALDEFKGWKWWEGGIEGFDRDKFIEELADVSHFTAALAVAVACTDEEWREAYWRKHAIIQDRHSPK